MITDISIVYSAIVCLADGHLSHFVMDKAATIKPMVILEQFLE